MVSKAEGGKYESHSVKKSSTGIQGLDEITGGGLPKNRASLICGGPGCGKTLLSMEFICNGITKFSENGAYISFDESQRDLSENVASLGFDIEAMAKKNTLCILEVPPLPEINEELGAYELGGIYAMLNQAIDSVGAKRVVIDGLETVFSVFQNESVFRRQLRKLFTWLKERNVTALITCERGEGTVLLSRHGIEEYVSDCVILLDQRVIDQLAVRRLKIIKYRGTLHGTNEYPFLITENGISILPITSMMLNYSVSKERLSTGIDKLDSMLSEKGYFKGSSILISGTAGTGKSSIAAHLAASVCKQEKRCIYFAFEEPAEQIVRNMQSIGLDLSPYVDKGLLKFHTNRPTQYGIEMHLLSIHNIIESFKPETVVFDPISNLTDVAAAADIKSMFGRLLDHLKNKQITTLSTNLVHGEKSSLATEIGISSIMDTWILIKNSENERKKERSIEIVKSRGMTHTDRINTFEITDNGIIIKDI
jgi:circadian clock protein KaiC